MKRFMKMIMKILLIVAFGFFATTIFADPLDMQLQNTIQQFLTQNKMSSHLSGVQLSVLLPGENKPRDYVVGTQRFGKSNPATTQMMMQWGSVTKEYTSLLIFKLQQDGDLNVHDTLQEVLPEHFIKNANDPWPQSWKNITLIQLMNMTSGISSYTSDSISIYNPKKMNSMRSLVDIAAARTNKGCTASQGCFPAGTAWYYSNTNYIILGLIVEHYTGLTFHQALNQYIFNPFRASNNNIYVHYFIKNNNAEILHNMFHGYFNNKHHIPFWQSEWADLTDDNLSWAASAGALVGNMNTLARLTNALYHNKLVTPVFSPTPVSHLNLEQNAVQTINGKPVTNIATQCLPTSSSACYAMGLGLSYEPGIGKMWWYAGATIAYNTHYVWIPSEHVIIAVAQSNGGNGDLAILVNKINHKIRKYYLHLPTTKTNIKFPSENFSGFALR
ncbi:MAG: hypothetical protein A3E81_02220 [Gammaproteobacteria bacterium RIFCSPHIGHO2_12_FULL_36_30]|nr:MAG: hypothetical protein A3E81_02220 [Gammaproteobacteria bacterium RIFCSPHIGHO2_12_FULL_36_30]